MSLKVKKRCIHLNHGMLLVTFFMLGCNILYVYIDMSVCMSSRRFQKFSFQAVVVNKNPLRLAWLNKG